MRRVVAFFTAVVLLGVGCAGDSESTTTSSPNSSTSTDAAETADPPPPEFAPTDAFPVTVEHINGSTVVPAAPRRVLTLGLDDRDVVFALGITPVAVGGVASSTAELTYAWMDDAAKAIEPVVFYDDLALNYERIAAFEPDLILGVANFMSEPQFVELSKIAPTVGQIESPDLRGRPWQQVTRVVAKAVGQSARGETLISDLEARFAQVRSENPSFAGRRVIVVTHSGATEDVFYTDSQSAGVEFVPALGFELAPVFGRGDPAELDDLDLDLLIWNLGTKDGRRAEVEADPRIQALAVTKANNVVYMEDELAVAYTFQSVLSLPFVLDKLTPLLQTATT